MVLYWDDFVACSAFEVVAFVFCDILDPSQMLPAVLAALEPVTDGWESNIVFDLPFRVFNVVL